MKKYMQCLAGVVLSLVAFASMAQGGGLWLYEVATPNLGTAGAGQAALAADASTALSNPAGMTHLDRSQMLIGFQALYYDNKFDTESASFGGGNGGQAGGWIPSGSFSYVHDVSTDLKFGLFTGSYFGLGLERDQNWSGRYYNTEAEFVTYLVNPSAAYRVNNWLSLGAGIDLIYAELHQEVAVNNSAVPGQAGQADGELEIDNNDVAYGFNLGIMLEPQEGSRLGLTYRSEVDLEFEDTVNLTGIGNVLQGILDNSGLAGSKVDIDMTMPQTVMLSGYQKINKRLALMGNIGWQDWSSFGSQDFTLNATTSTSFTKDLDYDDTYHFALGAQYLLFEDWLWSVGVAYDTSPVDDDDRTLDMPLDRQIRIGTGVQYTLNADMTIGLAYEYLDLGDAKVDLQGGNLNGDFKGENDTHVLHFIAVSLSYKF